MKRFLALLLTITLIVTLSACGKNDAPTDDSTISNEPSDQTQYLNNPTTTPSSNNSHVHTYSKKVTNPTCTEKGYTTYTCSCGDIYKDNYTDVTHNYIDYCCSYCKKMDYENIYSFLKSYVLKNGKVNGESIDYIVNYEKVDGGSLMTTLTYDSSEDSLYFSDGAYLNQVGYALCFYIPKKYSTQYDFIGIMNIYNSNSRTMANGKINADGFTSNSPIPCKNYQGDSNNISTFTEKTRTCMNRVINNMKNFYADNGYGFTIKDMGFNVYS